MPAVRKIESRIEKSTDFNPAEMYLVTLTSADLETVVKAALVWNLNKEHAFERIITAGVSILRDTLPSVQRLIPSELH